MSLLAAARTASLLARRQLVACTSAASTHHLLCCAVQPTSVCSCSPSGWHNTPTPAASIIPSFGISTSSPPHRSFSSASSHTSDQAPHKEPSKASTTAGSLHITVEPLADQHEGISVLSLTRPDAKNAIGRQLLRELQEAVNVLRQERTTRCVIIRSVVPHVFCAGADLKERMTMTQAETMEFVGTLRKAFSEVQALPMPTIAAIEGAALGGGAELALATDIRVAGHAAVLAFPEAQLGIIPGAGGTQRLPRLVGASTAKELIFTGRRIKAEDALRLGLVDHVVPEHAAYNRALEIAAEIARCAPLSLRMAKAAIDHGMEVDLATGLCMEEAYYARLVPSRDRLEGLKAFAEKRPPRYQGE